MKLVRWVSEILADGSEIRSLSGRSAKLGDGFSRNPADRDELLEARTTKDIGRCRSVEEVQFGRVSWRRYGDRLNDAVSDPAVVGSLSVALVGCSDSSSGCSGPSRSEGWRRGLEGRVQVAGTSPSRNHCADPGLLRAPKTLQTRRRKQNRLQSRKRNVRPS